MVAGLETVSAGDGPVKLGMRPDHLMLDPQKPMPVRVQMTYPLGPNTPLPGKLAGSEAGFAASLQGVHNTQASDRVMRFAIHSGQAHLFDRDSGLGRVGAASS
mmetsp:Transcript_6888/g.10899  ORF Transcript_6888/g.10899 Transcript_6888/m.10899 type:complete len:103 (-) Transcript_6888:4496-4804(-)